MKPVVTFSNGTVGAGVIIELEVEVGAVMCERYASNGRMVTSRERMVLGRMFGGYFE